MASKIIKRKHVSMKKKVGWRKNFNLEKDLQDLTEETSFLERTGDVHFDEIIEDKKPTLKQHIPARKLQKQKALENNARCFASLENTSQVPLPITVRNIRKKKKSLKTETSGKVSGAFQEGSLSERVENDEKFSRDLWNGSPTQIPQTENNQWFHTELKRHHLQKTSFVAPKITLDKRNRVKPVESPVVGSSYNPSAEEFKLLMDMTLEREKRIIKKEVKYANSLKKVYAKVSKNQIKRWRKEEFSQGFPNANGEFENTEHDEEDIITIENIPVINKKKNLRKKRKQTEEKLRRAKSKLAAIEILKMKDLKKIYSLENEIKIDSFSIAEKKKRQKMKKEQSKFQPGRIARLKYPGDELPLQSMETPAGSLRKVTIDEGSILVDRFKSLQKRNMIPVSIKRKPRKGRLATFKKSQYKNEI